MEDDVITKWQPTRQETQTNDDSDSSLTDNCTTFSVQADISPETIYNNEHISVVNIEKVSNISNIKSLTDKNKENIDDIVTELQYNNEIQTMPIDGVDNDNIKEPIKIDLYNKKELLKYIDESSNEQSRTNSRLELNKFLPHNKIDEIDSEIPGTYLEGSFVYTLEPKGLEFLELINVNKESLESEEKRRRIKNVLKEQLPKTLLYTSLFLALSTINLITEMALVVNYFLNKDIKFSMLTAFFVFLPSVLLGWCGGKTFCLRLFFAYVSTYYYAYRAKRTRDVDKKESYYEKMKKEHTDASAVTILKRVSETAPQLLIQLSLLLFMNIKDVSHTATTYLQLSTIFLSIIVLTITVIFWDWSLFLYEKASTCQVDDSHNTYTFKEVILQFFAYFFIITSRMMSLSLLASVHPIYSTNALIFHLVLATILIYTYSDSTKTVKKMTKKLYFSILSAFVLTFLPISFKDRKSYWLLYSMYFLESIAATIFSILTCDQATRENVWYIVFFALNYICFALGSIISYFTFRSVFFERINLRKI